MSKAKTYLSAFNRKMMEFVDEMIELVPEEGQFRAYKTGLEILVSSTPRVPMKFYNDLVLAPYGQQIAARDESFFLDTVLTDDLATSHDDMTIVPKLREYWADLDQDNKTAIWAYLILLQKIVVEFLKFEQL